MRFIAVLLSALCLATPALAYVGPGAGMGAIGVLAAVIGGVLLLLVGFLWYPFKRMMRNRRNTEELDPKTDKK